MSRLQLTVRSEGRNDRHARLGVFQNGAKAGVLLVGVEHEEAVIRAITHGTIIESMAAKNVALLEACRAAYEHAIADPLARLDQPQLAAMQAAIAKATETKP